MNNKVVLFGDAKKRKQIENVLSKHLEKNDVLFEIQSISDSEQFLKKFFFEDDFRLFMAGEKGTVPYLLKIYKNFDRHATRFGFGKMKFPLTKAEIANQILEVLKASHLCPYGTYAAKNGKMSRLIQHKDIECIFKKNKKSVFFLQSKEFMEVPDSQYRILEELDSKYFFTCKNGYIVNFFNIKKISPDYKSLTLKSGVELPMSRSGKKQFFKSLAFSIAGVDAFYY